MEVEMIAVKRRAPQASVHSRVHAENRVENRDPILGQSPAIEELRRLIGMVANSEATVLIEGETGTGKELVARAIHQASFRARAPFVVFNAASLPEQLFESELFGHTRGAFTGAAGNRRGLAAAADRGTLFIDEVGEVALANQARLLRFLDTKEVRQVGSVETREVDLRIVCATNRNLAQEVARGRFRADLYFRLRVLTLWTPPLRERVEDLPLLIQHFIRRLSVRHSRPGLSLTPEARGLLAAHLWKGNVRELRNELERAAILTPFGRPIGVESFSPEVRSRKTCSAAAGYASRLNLRQRLRNAERDLVMQVLEEVRGDLYLAAEQLRISHPALLHRLETLNLAPATFA